MTYDSNEESRCLEFLEGARAACQTIVAAIGEFDTATNCDPVDTEIAALLVQEELTALAARLYGLPCDPPVARVLMAADFYERAGETWRQLGTANGAEA